MSYNRWCKWRTSANGVEDESVDDRVGAMGLSEFPSSFECWRADVLDISPLEPSTIMMQDINQRHSQDEVRSGRDRVVS